MKNNKDSVTETNPLLCDPDSGVCEIPGEEQTSNFEKIPSNENKVRIVYFTDPICSSCWGIEPQLRKLKLEYGDQIEIEYRMGGLLKDWSYNSGGISKPSDVASHWDEVSANYDMPIDGDLWLEDPLASSYPPSIAFKAAQIQDEKKAILFLREIRENVFLQKKNICNWEYLATAATKVGLDTVLFKTDYENKAIVSFNQDLKLAKEYGVRGFPTLFFLDSIGQRETVYGFRPYPDFEKALLKSQPQIKKKKYDPKWESLFNTYPSLTAKEFSELSFKPRQEAEAYLNNLTDKGALEKFTTKNGSIWRVK